MTIRTTNHAIMMELLGREIGDFEFWDDISMAQLDLRVLSTGKIYHIDWAKMSMMSEAELLGYIIDLISERVVEQSQPYMLEDSTEPKAKRIKELNKELDIIRGRVPTPKGYVVDPARAKALIAELRELLK